MATASRPQTRLAKALSRFEVYGKHRDFKTFHFEQAVGFKKHLAEQKAKLSGEKLSKATLNATLNQLKQFGSSGNSYSG